MAATNKYLARSNKSARGRKRLRSVKPHNQALFANEGAGVARFWDAKDQTKCEVKPWPHQQMLVFALQRIGEGAIEVAAHAPSHRRRMNGNPADNGKKTMRKLLTILLVTGLAISPAVATANGLHVAM